VVPAPQRRLKDVTISELKGRWVSEGDQGKSVDHKFGPATHVDRPLSLRNNINSGALELCDTVFQRLAPRECGPQFVRVHWVLAACVPNVEAVVSGQSNTVWSAPTAPNAQYQNVSVWGIVDPFELEIGETWVGPISDYLSQSTFLNIEVSDRDAKNL
jgi:hypothetical protein